MTAPSSLGINFKTFFKCPTDASKWQIYTETSTFKNGLKKETMDWVDSPDVRVECLDEEPSPKVTFILSGTFLKFVF